MDFKDHILKVHPFSFYKVEHSKNVKPHDHCRLTDLKLAALYPTVREKTALELSDTIGAFRALIKFAFSVPKLMAEYASYMVTSLDWGDFDFSHKESPYFFLYFYFTTLTNVFQSFIL